MRTSINSTYLYNAYSPVRISYCSYHNSRATGGGGIKSLVKAITPTDNNTCLFDLDAMHEALAQGADSNCENGILLLTAIISERADVIELLLNAGADMYISGPLTGN